MIIRCCDICGKEFEASTGHTLRCSSKCRAVAKANWKRKCEQKKKNVCSINVDTHALAKAEREARELGYSYGMYMAMRQREMIG